MSAGHWIDDHATLLAIGGTVLISFMNWRTAVAAKKSPLHERLKETISNHKDFADRIANNLDTFFMQLLPRMLPLQSGSAMPQGVSTVQQASATGPPVGTAGPQGGGSAPRHSKE